MKKKSDMVFMTVMVDGNRPLSEAITATGREIISIDKSVLSSALCGGADVGLVTVAFFQNFNESGMEQEFKCRNLRPAPLKVLAAVNELDNCFSDSYPNLTFWKKGRKLCFASFDRRIGVGRVLEVGYVGPVIANKWWIAGVPQ